MKPFLAVGIICIVFHIIHCESVSAIAEEPLPDIRSMSMGNVHALSHEIVNPAYLSFQEKPRLGIAIHNRFQVKELNTCDAFCMIPNRWLDTGVKISGYGYSEYSLLSGQVGFSKKLGASISLGCNASCAVESVGPEDESHATVNIDGGMFYRFSETMDFALLVENFIGNDDDKIFLLYSGAGWNISPSYVLVLELTSDFNRFFSLMAGLEYQLVDKFYVRAGFQTSPKLPALGVSYSYNGFTMDLCFSSHSVLGTSSSIGLSFEF